MCDGTFRWRHMGVMSCQIKSQGTWLFSQELVQTNIKENTKASHYDPFEDEIYRLPVAWWSHQMKTFSALLSLFAKNSPLVTGEFPSQASEAELWYFFDPRLKRLNKQSRCWWFERRSRSLWRNYNGFLLHGASDVEWVWIACRE